jgi:hypothetical protein
MRQKSHTSLLSYARLIELNYCAVELRLKEERVRCQV